MTLEQDLDHGILSSLSTYEAGALQAAAHRNLQKYSDNVLDSFGITKMQWLIIGIVVDAKDGYVREADLAESLGTTMPYMTEAVNHLVTKSILHKDSENRTGSSQKIYVESSFAPKIMQIENTFRDSLRSTIYVGVSSQDLRTYMKVLYRLSKVAS